MRLLGILCAFVLLAAPVLASHNIPQSPPYNCTTLYSKANATLHEEVNCSATAIDSDAVNISFTDDFSPTNTSWDTCSIQGTNMICEDVPVTGRLVHGKNGQQLHILLLGSHSDGSEDYTQAFLALTAVILTGVAYYLYRRKEETDRTT